MDEELACSSRHRHGIPLLEFHNMNYYPTSPPASDRYNLLPLHSQSYKQR